MVPAPVTRRGAALPWMIRRRRSGWLRPCLVRECYSDSIMVSLAARPSHPALAPFVKSLHYHKGEMPALLERIVPSGQAHLMVNLAEDEFRTYGGLDCRTVARQRGAVLAGPHAQATVIDTKEQRWLVAVEFKLGGAAPFFAFPMSEISDQVAALDLVWGREEGTLRERLLEAGTPAAMFRRLEAALLAHLIRPRNQAIAFAVSILEKGASVAEARARLGLLPKTFVRRFREQVGLPPKRLARVCRLQRIVGAVRGSRDADWCMLAAEHGYTDQAHLIHDFRDLTGITPTAYQPSSPQRRNHVPIPAPNADVFLQYSAATRA